MVATGQATGDPKVYAIAGRFKNDALGSGLSVFTPDRPIWSEENFAQLIEGFVEAPDYGAGTFDKKLAMQLATVDSGAKQLMSELLALHLLITMVVTAPTKQKIIELPLSGLDVALPPDVLDALGGGFVNPGAIFNTGRPNQLMFLVRAGHTISALSTDDRLEALADPWRFRSAIENVPINSAATQRHALLHLFFPDTFEAVVSDSHIGKITDYFSDQVDGITGDGDRDLLAIRAALESKFGVGFDFYNARLAPRWRGEGDPWVSLVRWSSKLMASPQFVEDERSYKLEVANVGSGLLSALANGSSILEPLGVLQTQSGLLDFRAADDFLQWSRGNETSATAAISGLLDEPGGTVAERIDAFGEAIKAAVKSPGNVVAQASLFLSLTDPSTFPIYRPTPFTSLLGYLGAKHRKSPLGRRYEDALYACDFLIAEIADGSNSRLKDRLGAQSLIWVLTNATPDKGPVSHWPPEDRDAFMLWRDGPDLSPPEVPGTSDVEVAIANVAVDADDLFASAARMTHLPVSFLKGMEQRLIAKGQIVSYGPPGTGKTFVARHLAAAMAGSADRTALVQFHPSTTYEDFFEGIRPTTVNGQIEYSVVKGPLALLADRAESDPEHRYVLIIDELNRANVPKVLGELMFLLEYRNTEALTLYRPKQPFKLPSNLYVIATMNTVDRSVAVLDGALRRRFQFVPFFPDSEPIKSVLASVCSDEESWVAEFLDEVNVRLLDMFGSRDHLLGASYFIGAERTVEGVRDVWLHSIEPTLEDQLFGQPEQMSQFRWAAIAEALAEIIPADGECTV